MSAVRTMLGGSSFLAGIVAADLARPSWALACFAGGAGAICCISAAVMHLRAPEPQPGALLPELRAAPAAFLAAGLAAAGFCGLGTRLAALESSAVPAFAGQTITLTGRLATDPRPNRFSHRFEMSVRTVETDKVRERVAVSAYGRLPHLELDDLVEMEGKVRKLDLRDPFDARLSRESVAAKVSVSGRDIRILQKTQNPFFRLAGRFRSRMETAALAGAGKERSALLLGLVIGDSRRIPAATVENFRAAGLSHLTAVSGQNVAMVLVPLVLTMTALRVSRRLQVAVGAAVLGLFAIVTRWEPSVLRAVLMAGAGLSAWLFGRRSEPRHGLALVFFALLVVDPLLLWSIGFQLSFAATAGILLIGPALADRLSLPLGTREERTPATTRTGPAVRAIQATAIAAAAQAAVFPLVAWHFEVVPLLSLPANLAVIPLVAPLTVLGLAGGVLAMLSVEAAGPLMFASGILVSALQKAAGFFGGSAFAQTRVWNFGWFELAAACLVVAAAGMWVTGNARAARWPAVTAVLLLITAGFSNTSVSAPAGMRLTFFDVGQGDAALVEGPSGARILIDGGPDPTEVAARLKAKGVGRLDLLIASHGHQDHVEGLAEVLRRIPVRIAVDPGIPTPAMDEIAGTAAGAASRFQPSSSLQAIRVGDLTVDFLGPGPGERLRVRDGDEEGSGEGSALNDASVVARVSFGRGCALFPGDLEEEGQQAVLDAHGASVRCTVLKAPHHGSGRLLAAFVSRVDPDWTVVSVGPNRFGHPAPKALSLFGRGGARVLRTDQMGDVVLELEQTGKVRLVE